MIYILNRKCKTGNMLYINNCSCISFRIANPFSIRGKPQNILQLTLSVFKSKLHCRCITIIQYISLDWSSKIAVQALVDHTQLLVVWCCLHHWSLCQLAFLPICRAFVMKEWHTKKKMELPSEPCSSMLALSGNKWLEDMSDNRHFQY